MPTLISGNTQAPSSMIGEEGAANMLAGRVVVRPVTSRRPALIGAGVTFDARAIVAHKVGSACD
jgi:hypothetical protein